MFARKSISAANALLVAAVSCTFHPTSSFDGDELDGPQTGGVGDGGVGDGGAGIGGAGDGGAGDGGVGDGGVGGDLPGVGGAQAGGGDCSPCEPGGMSGGGGAPAVGGAAGASEAGASNTPTSAFTLRFRDEFDELDPTRWQVMDHSWEGNLALFSAEMVSTSGGNLKVSLRNAPEGTEDSTGSPKSFLGAEVRSVDTLTYGRVRARAKFARGSAVVSALAGIYTPWPADNWNELDIEQLGKLPESVQFNTLVYTGALPAPRVPVTPSQEPYLHDLEFDATADFHVYAFEWTPEGAAFSIDDRAAYRWTKRIHLMTLPQNVLLSIWASSSEGWAGPVTAATGQASAQFDWIELYDYSPVSR
jgi:endo-1,3-1,4-beta-glycanase ExoK